MDCIRCDDTETGIQQCWTHASKTRIAIADCAFSCVGRRSFALRLAHSRREPSATAPKDYRSGFPELGRDRAHLWCLTDAGLRNGRSQKRLLPFVKDVLFGSSKKSDEKAGAS